MAKTIYTPNENAKAIRKVVADNGAEMTFGQIKKAMGENAKVGTATITALVNNGYLVGVEKECSCCGEVKKFYSATDKAI